MGATHAKKEPSRTSQPSSRRAKTILGVIASAALILLSFFGAYTFASSMRTDSSASTSLDASSSDSPASVSSASAAAASSSSASASASTSAASASSSSPSSSSAKEETPNKTGIDVSETQGEIDWKAVAADGIEFAFVRIGYRGSSEGQIYADETYKQNLAGARAAGIECGAYFYSQALNEQEAEEEARYMIDSLEGMELEYPVVFDYEVIGPSMYSRIASIAPEDATKAAIAFCKEIENAGYKAMIYGNSYDLDHLNVDELKTWPIWYAEYNEQPSYSGDYVIWQYSCTGTVSGINMEVDMNLDMRTVTGPNASKYKKSLASNVAETTAKAASSSSSSSSRSSSTSSSSNSSASSSSSSPAASSSSSSSPSSASPESSGASSSAASSSGASSSASSSETSETSDSGSQETSN